MATLRHYSDLPSAFYQVPPNTDKLLAKGWDGLDIMHGHLKSLMYEAQGDNENGEPTDPYARGVFDTLCEMYRLTYAIMEAKESN